MEIKSWRELNKGRKKKSLKKVQTPAYLSPMKNQLDKKNSYDSPSYPETDTTKQALPEFYNEDMGERITREDSMSRKKFNMSSGRHISTPKHPAGKARDGGFRYKWWLFFIMVAVLITVAGAWRWAGPQADSQELVLTIAGPEVVAVGEEAVWKIKYQNVGRVDLLRMELSVNYPAGFKIRSTIPEAIDSLNKSWDIGRLSPNQSGEVEIRAQIFGEEGNSKILAAEMIYQPANFSSDFVFSTKLTVKLANSQIAMDFIGPESTLPETENDWQVKIKNISAEEINETELRLTTSYNFKMRESEPEIDSINDTDETNKVYVWPRRRWQQQQEVSFSWNGKFDPAARGVEEMKVEIISYQDGIGKVLQEKMLNIPILGEELALDLSVNGGDQLAEVSAGTALNYKIAIHNTSGEDLKDLTAVLRLTPEYIDWANLTAPAEPVFSTDGNIILKSEKYDKLKLLKTGEKLEFDIKVRVKDNISAVGAQVKASAGVQVGMVGDKTKDDLSFSTRTIVTDIKVPVKLYVDARYYDDEGIPIGSGPIPPKVGEATTYVISFSIGKISKAFNRITITAALPPAVNWQASQQVERGIFGFSPSSRQISWQLDDIGSLPREISAQFEVSITPQIVDIGEVINLLSATSLTGQADDETSFSVSAPALDTNLTGALYGSGQGEVMPAE